MVALTDFHKAQCFFVLATNIAALVVTRRGGLEPPEPPADLQHLDLSESDRNQQLLPSYFHDVELVFVSSIVTYTTMGQFSPSQFEMKYLASIAASGGPSECDFKQPGGYCYLPPRFSLHFDADSNNTPIWCILVTAFLLGHVSSVQDLALVKSLRRRGSIALLVLMHGFGILIQRLCRHSVTIIVFSRISEAAGTCTEQLSRPVALSHSTGDPERGEEIPQVTCPAQGAPSVHVGEDDVELAGLPADNGSDAFETDEELHNSAIQAPTTGIPLEDEERMDEDQQWLLLGPDSLDHQRGRHHLVPPWRFVFLVPAWLLFSLLLARLVMRDALSLTSRAAKDEQERLLTAGVDWEEMVTVGRTTSPKDSESSDTTASRPTTANQGHHFDGAPQDHGEEHATPVYRVYKRRWFGLMQLVLMNIIWLSYSPVANTAAAYFSTTSSVINWLSTAFLFAFVVASPFTVYALHRGGPRLALITSSLLILFGNWIRYAGTRASPPSFPAVMVGQILIGLAQPFVLSAPTHYSSLWFSPSGRVSATAIASLANPFGGALGQLINPFLASEPDDIHPMTLYIALISSVATIPSLFIPSGPPTPVSASSSHAAPPLRQTLRLLAGNTNYILLLFPFAIYVGLFNAISSLLTQILTPYSFTETASGIAGALLILVGLVAAAITSPLIDRSKRYLPLIRALVPVIALAYLAFIWAPGTRSPAAPYVICAVLGAASFSLVPVALEWAVEITWPAGPEASSTLCWTGGQLLGGIFIVVCDALKEDDGQGDPKGNMGKGLVFMAVVAGSAVPCALLLGRFGGGAEGEGGRRREGRLEVDKGGGGGGGTGGAVAASDGSNGDGSSDQGHAV
ncbi:MAG: hypothetical protein LQ344_005152 [Seirophora lacunosa]|nr:MAG: hypothetical protein LQ344_005152 [Seirophora lacunosa]